MAAGYEAAYSTLDYLEYVLVVVEVAGALSASYSKGSSAMRTWQEAVGDVDAARLPILDPLVP